MESISEECAVNQAATGSAQPEPVVSVRGLVKRYGSREAVAGIDLEVRRGEIFACLGPNGAGKTTTVEILEGFGQRTEGQVCVLGHDPATAGGAWRDRVGVVLQESEPEPGLTVRESLALYAGFYRAPRDVDETIALVGLTEQAGTLGTRLSGGQRRRLDFALALIGDPELIFLDEPTTVFDPSARLAGETDQCKTLVDVPRRAVEPGVQGQALPDGQAGLGLRLLQDHAHPVPPGAARGGRVVPQDTNLARCALLEAFEDLYRRGLARAVGAEEGEDLSPSYLEIDARDRLVAAVALNQAAHADHRLGLGRAGGCLI